MAENEDPRPGDNFRQWATTTRDKHIGHDLCENEVTYVPYSELKRYWTIQRINAVLRSYDKPLPFDAPSIQEAYLRIFSTLVWTGTTRRFLGLVLINGLDDHQWPAVGYPTNWHGHNNHSFLADFKSLKEAQWVFFPYRFEKSKLHKTLLNRGCILPIETLETIVKRGDSLIHKIKISDEYNGLTPSITGRYFALKDYDLRFAEDRYQTEVDALTMLRQSPSENLVTFYGSFCKDGHGFIILEFAERGDLKMLFQETPPPTTAEEILVFWKSLTMSLQGLDRIHQLMSVDQHMKNIIQGIHQDIKPANILLIQGSSSSLYDFQPKIADFGLFSHARKMRSNSEEAKGPNKYGNQIFSAPEVSTNPRNKLKGLSFITPSADIFSFGAVLSAAAAFVAGGQQFQQEYFDKRRAAHAKLRRFSKSDFEGCFHAGVDKFPVIEEMHRHIAAICRDQKQDTITEKILEIVQQHMLLPKWSERDPAALLIDRFGSILWNEPLSPTISLSTARRRSTWMTTGSENNDDGGETTPKSLNSLRSINTFFEGKSRSRLGSWGSTSAENSKVLDPTVKNLIDQITRNLRDRDQFFFIDDSTSMAPHERIVLEGFQALSSIAKRLDPNRVELAFASRPQKVHRARSTKSLVGRVREHKYEHDPTMMARSLSYLVEHQIVRKLPVKKMGFNVNLASRKQTSVYIFTDGNWGDDPKGACGVEYAVKYLMDEVERRHLTRQQVTLHFVRFGDSEAGGRHLDFLDRYGEEFHCDIVDVKHISSDVESLFVGPLTYYNDRKDELR